ncbi:hypothetical protein LPTSP3_g14800 [Leptospira kobayashii]|uniref:HYDIN/VesB/CFA65-like Ig-like domain-containing protein n=1 Tax=Leptospira kobayashii TaxID=1917830 RepID=A0ABM7UIH4_9LEPT|nr:kelch repeat-containing protein [Leptospira kobayashii]BDA78550.1 hypothetical protein LPTSP3_g14800 [Leptospira kobayashii]
MFKSVKFTKGCLFLVFFLSCNQLTNQLSDLKGTSNGLLTNLMMMGSSGLGGEIIVKDATTTYLKGALLNFPIVRTTETSATATFSLKNIGTGDLTLTSTPNLVLSGINSNEFSIAQPALSVITPDSFETFTITFTPTSFGYKEVEIRIPNDSNTSDFAVYIRAHHSAPGVPTLTLKEGGNQFSIQNLYNNYTFAQTNLNTTKTTTFTISNTGASDSVLSISSLTLTGADQSEFSMTLPSRLTLNSGESTTFTATFRPTLSPGSSKHAELTISSNDSYLPDLILKLHGFCPIGSFHVTGSMNVPRDIHTATLLNNGKVLIAGGYSSNVGYLSSAELYDPNTGTFSTTGSLTEVRTYHTATLLGNGKVLIVGGNQHSGTYVAAELYDPNTETFTTTGSLNVGRRFGHTATLLNDGKVLVAGGISNPGGATVVTSAELYDPNTGVFTLTGNMISRKHDHTATLLNNGKVLIAVGSGGPGSNSWAKDTELYDPVTGTFASSGRSIYASGSDYSALLLNDGKVLIGGTISPFDNNPLSKVELYDPNSETFSLSGSINRPTVQRYKMVLLNNGKVFVAGGNSSDIFLSNAELYDPNTGLFTFAGKLSSGRDYHTMTRLGDGRVLIVGGRKDNITLSSAEIYSP